jgi:predicted RND superfamily exporter protein
MTPYERAKKWRLDNPEKYKEYHKTYRKKNAAKYKEYIGKWQLKNNEKYIITSIKSRAKKLGIEFNIDATDIKIPPVCPILGIPILKEFKGDGNKGPRATSPSLDRIDNAKGYVKGNVHIISNKANVMKNSATPKELLQFAFWVILTYGHLIDKEIS